MQDVEKEKRIYQFLAKGGVCFLSNNCSRGVYAYIGGDFVAFSQECYFAAIINRFFFLLVPCALRICYRFFEKSQDCTWAVLYVIVFAAFVMIWTLPSSVGGLGSQKVAYYDDSGVCQEYDYYGVADEMLVLINNNKVSLIPIGDGHIEYVVSRYSFFGPKEDEQKACGVDPVNSAPDADLQGFTLYCVRGCG